MDMMVFSTMMGFIGMAMSSFIPDAQMYGDARMSDSGHNAGNHDYVGGDMSHGYGGPGDMSGFDVNF